MPEAETLITEHLETWSAAIKKKSSAGRGGGKKQALYGINRLRELVLELAVRGLIVPQNPDDEPASKLLMKIAAEKVKLIKSGELKKQKSLRSVSGLEKHFPEPNQWQYCRLGDLMNLVSGQHLKPAEYSETLEEGAIPYLTGPAEFGPIHPRASRFTFERRSIASPGDVLITCKGSGVGKLNLADQEIFISRQLMAVQPIVVTSAFVMLLAESLNKHLRSNIVGIAIPGISRVDVNEAAVCLPPLAEQNRIVAKVDELMALCDQLEQQQEDSMRTHQTLVQTLLGALTAASERGQFEEAWQRIESNFDTLFTTESSIDELKQTILQLAVMAKLVPQDPNDGSVCSKSISKKATSPNPDDTQFAIPAAWEWLHLNDLANIIGGFAFKSSQYQDKGTRVIRISDFDENGFKDHKVVKHASLPDLEKFSLQEGDILMAMTGGTVGKSFHIQKLPEPMLLNQRVASIRATPETKSSYLNLVIQSSLTQRVIQNAKNSTNDNISMRDIKGLLVPLPPLAEQHRIVAKVDELMALCDALKANLKSAQTTQLTLADTLTEKAVS